MALLRGAAPAAAGLALLVAGCGSPSGPSPSPRTSHPPSPTPSPSPAPGPDTETVTVTASGVGAWQLVAIPVALLRNDAHRHGAEEVVVHFTTHSPSGATGSLSSTAVDLAPGETLPVAADCTDGCNNATSTDVSVSVGLWTPAVGPSFSAGPAAYACGSGACGGGHGQGSATAPVTATSSLAEGVAVAAFAACTNAAGAIVGAGVTTTSWPGGTTATVKVPVIVNSAPAACSVGASTSW